MDGCDDDSSQLVVLLQSFSLRVSLARPLRIRRLNALSSTTFSVASSWLSASGTFPRGQPHVFGPVNCGVVGRSPSPRANRQRCWVPCSTWGPSISSRLYPSYPYPTRTYYRNRRGPTAPICQIFLCNGLRWLAAPPHPNFLQSFRFCSSRGFCTDPRLPKLLCNSLSRHFRCARIASAWILPQQLERPCRSELEP